MLNKFIKNNKNIEKEILGINERNSKYVYVYNDQKNYKFADDKLLTKEILHKYGLPCPETYAVISRIGDIEEIWYQLQHYSKLVIKPAKGSGGGGIKVLMKHQGYWYQGNTIIEESQIFSHIANIIFGMYSFGDSDRVIIEEVVQSHSGLKALYPKGVADIRIVLVEDQPVMGMLRLPTQQSGGKANLHQGGLGVGIDLKTGILTQAYDGKRYSAFHPDSLVKIDGVRLPYWKELMELAVKSSEAFPLNYLGIDIVIDEEKGPLVLEINVRPGLGIQMANKTGLKEALKNIRWSG
ncbi:MAG: hypothetical protein MI700_00285 [Balneolales bacterium]|nr:hypothetical protein [Balneolales bacterium]